MVWCSSGLPFDLTRARVHRMPHVRLQEDQGGKALQVESRIRIAEKLSKQSSLNE